MKLLPFILALLCASCAGTTLYQDGKPIVRIEGDCRGLTFHRLPSGEITLSGDITHSTVITAHGAAAQQILLASAPVITASGLPRLIH